MSNEKMVIVSYGKEYQVRLVKSEYKSFGCMYLGIQYYDPEDEAWEPYSDLTVGLDYLMPGFAFVDTNNLECAEEFIKKYHLGKPTGTVRRSGFCQYPLYEFDMEMVERYLA